MTDGWTVQATGGAQSALVGDRAVPAVVPGEVHLDLLREGLIPDPFLDDHEALTAWIGRTDWTYRSTFTLTAEDLAAHARHDLVFAGIDTVARILLNGRPLAHVANQHRGWRFDVTDALSAGSNELIVEMRSPVSYANEQSQALGPRQRPYSLPYEAIRKAACSFGWDWGISTCSVGIWKPVTLESWSVARLQEVRLRTETEDPAPDGAPSAAPAVQQSNGRPGELGSGRVLAEVLVERESPGDAGEELALELELEEGGGRSEVRVPAGTGSIVLDLAAGQVRRWWPAGHGEQPLYDVTLRLRRPDDGADSADDAPLDAASRRVGFRTVAWSSDPDEHGTPLQLLVNGRPVYVKGVNWIPDDAFFTRVDRDRYARRLQQARDAHVNLVRVWGGGIYESDDFFDLCDELGLLTWQDFLFACAGYPEEEPLRTEVEAEARENIARIGHHASLVMLCGNNENLWGYEDWGWKDMLDGASWGAEYYHRLLPALVQEIAPQVPYSPGSPFSPGGQHPNDESHGSVHLWEQWNQKDWRTYREHRPRFVAEFGWQGPPAWSTLTRAISDAPLTPESPGMIVHQKAEHGNDKLTRGLLPHHRVPRDMELWHWAMQLNQATAVATALRWFRSLAPLNSGAVVWQLNDCWPVTSWAAIDGDEREKPLYHALAGAYAPRLITLQPTDGGLEAVLCNDTAESWEGPLQLARLDLDGAALAEVEIEVRVAPRGTERVTLPTSLAFPQDATRELVRAGLHDLADHWFFAEPRDSALPDPRFSATLRTVEDGVALDVTAETLLRDLTLLVDRVSQDARVGTGLVTLLPGRTATFRLTPAITVGAGRRGDVAAELAGLHVETLTAAHVLRSANQLRSADQMVQA
nr:glycoside hydrolase family 2 protein [Nesterenkonia xinjiangensis]